MLDRDDLELYDAPIAVEFIARIRGQVRFTDIDELIVKMADDVARCHELLASRVIHQTVPKRLRQEQNWDMFGLGPFGRWIAHTEPAADPAAGMNLLGSDMDELAADRPHGHRRVRGEFSCRHLRQPDAPAEPARAR